MDAARKSLGRSHKSSEPCSLSASVLADLANLARVQVATLPRPVLVDSRLRTTKFQ